MKLYLYLFVALCALLLTNSAWADEPQELNVAIKSEAKPVEDIVKILDAANAEASVEDSKLLEIVKELVEHEEEIDNANAKAVNEALNENNDAAPMASEPVAAEKTAMKTDDGDADDDEHLDIIEKSDLQELIKEPGMARLARQLNRFHRLNQVMPSLRRDKQQILPSQRQINAVNADNDDRDYDDDVVPEERAIRRRKRIRRRNTKNKVRRTHRNRQSANRRKSSKRRSTNRKSVNRRNTNRSKSKRNKQNNSVRRANKKKRRPVGTPVYYARRPSSKRRNTSSSGMRRKNSGSKRRGSKKNNRKNNKRRQGSNKNRERNHADGMRKSDEMEGSIAQGDNLNNNEAPAVQAA